MVVSFQPPEETVGVQLAWQRWATLCPAAFLPPSFCKVWSVDFIPVSCTLDARYVPLRLALEGQP